MKSDENVKDIKVFNACINEMRILINLLRKEFINNHSTLIPGVLDSTELEFYVNGGLYILNRLDRTLELAYHLGRNDE